MRFRFGFTLPELIIVMGIALTLVAIISNSLLGGQHQTSLNTTLATLIADIKAQQLKAMSGDTEGRAATDSYGIYVQANQYILFHGAVYSAGDLANSIIPLNTGLTLSTTFPNSILVFNKGDGQISGFILNQDTLTLTNSESVAKTLKFNKYGVIISQT